MRRNAGVRLEFGRHQAGSDAAAMYDTPTRIEAIPPKLATLFSLIPGLLWPFVTRQNKTGKTRSQT